MPPKKKEKWEIALQASAPWRGWTVCNERGRVRIKLQFPKGSAGPACSSASLPYPWHPDSQSAVGQLCGRIYTAVMSGKKTLKGAINDELAESDHKREIVVSDWREATEAFRHHLIENKNKIKEATYQSSYSRYFEVMLVLLQGRNAPQSGFELLDRVLHYQRFNQKSGKKFGELLVKWADQPASRRECCLAIRNLLEFAVHRQRQAQCWLINPFDYAELKGSTEKKRKKATLTDQEFMKLVVELDERGAGWGNVIRLLRVYGLRMWEVNHLMVTNNPKGDKQLFCSKGKVSATHGRKHENEPRFLFPIRVDGHDFDLQRRLERGELELPTGNDGTPMEIGGRNLGNRLRGLPYWHELQAAKDACGEWLRPYTFRDTYSIRATELGIHDSLASLAMGHTPEVHRRSYRTSDFALASDAFAKAQDGRISSQDRPNGR